MKKIKENRENDGRDDSDVQAKKREMVLGIRKSERKK